MKLLRLTCCILVFSALASLVTAQQKETASVATITELSGKVMILKNSETEWIRAQLYTPLENKDRVKTFVGSSAEITMEDGSIFKIEENTELVIGNMEFEKSKKRNFIVDLFRGILLSNVEKIEGIDSQVSIRTPTAVMAVRGTEFAVEVPDENSTDLAVYSGNVAVANFEGPEKVAKEEVMVNPQQQTTILQRQKPMSPYAIGSRMIANRDRVMKLRARKEVLKKNWKQIVKRRLVVRNEMRNRLKTLREKVIQNKIQKPKRRPLPGR